MPKIHLYRREQKSNVVTPTPREATVSHTTALPATITPAILDTILGHLAPHFLPGAANNLATARHVAARILAAYNAETEEELRLAAGIVSFSFLALEPPGEAASSDLSANEKLRLHGSAISFSREIHKAQRKLDQLQRTRVAASRPPETQAPPPEPSAIPDKPSTGHPVGLIEFASEALAANTNNGGIQAWTLSHQQRRAAERTIEHLTRNNAEHVRYAATAVAMPARTQIQQSAT